MGPEPRLLSAEGIFAPSQTDNKSEQAPSDSEAAPQSHGRGIRSEQVILDSPSRPRRRVGRLVWPMLIVVAVAVALVVSAAGDETRAELDYLESLRNQLSEISKDGDALRDVVARLGSIQRVEFETVIENMREDLGVAIAFAAGDPPSMDTASVAALYRLTVAFWDAGLEGFGESVLLAADQPRSLFALDNMTVALGDLETGDSLYVDLVAELAREDTPDPLTDMPEVRLVPGTGPLVVQSATYIQIARADGSGLALRPGLAVSQIVSVPEWEVDPNDQAVVPSTDTIAFSVVVTNLGNVKSEPGTLLLVLSGGQEPIEVEVGFDALEPSQQTTVSFDPMSVTPGGVYQVDVRLPVTAPDSDLTDNEVQVLFTVNE